ncbi:agouti-signaling protein 2b [Aulostomus maculatus]
MTRITGRHLCLVLLVLPLSCTEETKKDARKTDNDTGVGPVKTRRLFARQKVSAPQEIPKPKVPSALTVSESRCARLMESCSSNGLCCDPCASCHCRLFNTICHCWRMNPLCLKRTKIGRTRMHRHT